MRFVRVKMHCILLILSVLSVVIRVQSQCSIDIRNDLNRTATGTVKEPLFVKYSGSEYKLMIPDNGTLDFKTGASALVACTSDTKPNYLDYNEKASSTIFCVDGKNFNISNQQANVEEFNECKTVISGSVINRNEECGISGTKLSIGFQLSDGKGFVNFIDVCYNKKTASTIYTKHTVNGKAIKNAMKSSTRPSGFKTAEVPSFIAPATSFTKASQMKRFSTIFDNEDLAYEYLAITYLARGHLAPDGDGIFISWQMATYYYINVIPQWQSINNANWKSIESNVRSKAADLREDVIVYTGGHQVLELNGKKMTLEPDGLEVPKWSWKILKNPTADNGIAFVTFNNPFAFTIPTPLCTDICDAYGWEEKNYKTMSKGYTICCSVSDLMKAIPAIPEDARVTHILSQ